MDPCFDSKKNKIKFNDKKIDEILHILQKQLSAKVEKWTYKGSNWTIHQLIVSSTYNINIQHQLVISEIFSCEGNSYFLLPKELRN